MPIRHAKAEDWQEIGRLLDQLEYPGWEGFLEHRVAALVQDPDEILLVFEEQLPATGATALPDAEISQPVGILAFISLHFIPQIALAGDFARISYFAVDGSSRSKGIGQKMEEYAAGIARERGCHLIEVHCHTRRTDAHRFYGRQGFEESPKYLIKRLP